jgi:hypothetical protein
MERAKNFLVDTVQSEQDMEALIGPSLLSEIRHAAVVSLRKKSEFANHCRMSP